MFIENTVDIAAVDIAHADERAARFFAAAHVDLVARVALAVQLREQSRDAGEDAVCLRLHLFALKYCFERQKTHSVDLRHARGLDLFGVGNVPSEHLIAAADAENQRAAARSLLDRRLQPALAEPLEVGDRTLRTGNHDHIRRAQVPRPLHIAERDILVALKRRKIRKVRNARQADDRNVDEPRLLIPPEAFAQAILVVDVDMEVWHNARHGYAAELLKRFEPRFQNGAVTAEFVDNNALDAPSVLFTLQRDRAVELGEHAAAVDVAHQQHRRIHHAGKAHVDDVVFLQVDLRGAARALNNDDVILTRKALVGFHHRGDEVALSAIVFHRGHIALYASVHDDLTADVRRRLQ